LGLNGQGGVTGRADRIAITCIATFLAGFGLPYAVEVGVSLMALLGAITVGQRMFRAYRSAT
jgi:CDP-diacylglycerol--glycerol-3-phosphate 3-phosphatidyltransferase